MWRAHACCHLQADRNRQKQVDRDNAMLAKKLTAIAHAAPGTYHAPTGIHSLKVRLLYMRHGQLLVPNQQDLSALPNCVYLSAASPCLQQLQTVANNRDLRHLQRASGGSRTRPASAPSHMPCTRSHTTLRHWPPRAPRQRGTPALLRERELRIGNARLAAKLRATLSASGRCDQPSFATLSARPQFAQDLTSTMPRRAHLLDATNQHLHHRPGTTPWLPHQHDSGTLGRAKASQQRKDRSNGVPKSAGMLTCAGCGIRAFYAADGVMLHACPECKQVRHASVVVCTSFAFVLA